MYLIHAGSGMSRAFAFEKPTDILRASPSSRTQKLLELRMEKGLLTITAQTAKQLTTCSECIKVIAPPAVGKYCSYPFTKTQNKAKSINRRVRPIDTLCACSRAHEWTCYWENNTTSKGYVSLTSNVEEDIISAWSAHTRRQTVISFAYFCREWRLLPLLTFGGFNKWWRVTVQRGTRQPKNGTPYRHYPTRPSASLD